MINPRTLPPAVLDWAAPASRVAPRSTPGVAPLLARAMALAERLPPSVQGHDGDAAIFNAANELATVLGEDAAAIKQVLADVFNPRCKPAWGATKLDREATRAALRQATPEARYGRRSAARHAAPTLATTDNPLDALGTDPGLDSASADLDWLIHGLQIAPGKVTLLTAYAGSAKTPTAALLAVCVAAGVPCLGHATRRARTLYLAAEGGRNARRKILRIAKGLGLDAHELVRDGWLHIRDTRALEDEAPAALRASIAAHDLGFVIVDTITSALRGAEVGRNDEAYARMLWSMGEISEETRATMLALSHDSKAASGSDLRGTSGTSAIVEAAQTVIRLEPAPDDDKAIRISCARAVDDRFLPIGVRWVDGDGSLGAQAAAAGNGVSVPLRCELAHMAPSGRGKAANKGRADTGTDARLTAAKRALDTLLEAGSACTMSDLIANAGGVPRIALKEALLRLKNAGVITGGPSSYYALAETWRTPTPKQRAAAELVVRNEWDPAALEAYLGSEGVGQFKRGRP